METTVQITALRFFSVRCKFVLIVKDSALLRTLVLPACSYLAQPVCMGCPRGRPLQKLKLC